MCGVCEAEQADPVVAARIARLGRFVRTYEGFLPARNWHSLPRTLHLDLYQKAFALRERQVLVLFEDITKMFAVTTRNTLNGIPTGTYHSYAYNTRDGRRIRLGDDAKGGGIGGIQSAAEYIAERVYPRLLPEYLSRWLKGERLDFETFTLDMKSISRADKKELSWSEVKRIRFRNGVVRVESRKKPIGTWSKQTVGLVANLPLFVRFASQVTEVK